MAPTREQLIEQAVAHMKRATITPDAWANRIQSGYRGKPYNYPATENYKAQQALWDAVHAAPAEPPPLFGSDVDAGVFAGRGIMLGGNRDVWDQARALANTGHVDVVAIPANQNVESFSCRVVRWNPPEIEPRIADIHQAEKQSEWNAMIGQLSGQTPPRGLILNDWRYGAVPAQTAVFVELYANEGWGIDFGVFANYAAAGASAVIPLCGAYPAAGRSNAEAAAIYASLDGWSGGVFPAKWMYAGEDPLTDECVQVLKGWTR